MAARHRSELDQALVVLRSGWTSKRPVQTLNVDVIRNGETSKRPVQTVNVVVLRSGWTSTRPAQEPSAPAPSVVAESATRRPRPRDPRRPYGSRSPPDSDGESDPPLAAKSTGPLTAAMRSRVKEARDADARRRVEREKKARLPDGIDRDLYCARGIHLREPNKRIVPDRSKSSGFKTYCAGCKADDDAAGHASSKTSWWVPVLPPRLVAAAGLLVEPPDLVVIEFGEDHGDQEGKGL